VLLWRAFKDLEPHDAPGGGQGDRPDAT